MLPRALNQAIALQTLSELLRRYSRTLQMRLVELHPDGGMYDCLGLVSEREMSVICQFHLEGSSLAFNEPGVQAGPARPNGSRRGLG